MKKLLFIISLMSLIAVGCNRNQGDTESGAGGSSSMERQQEEASPSQNMDAEGSEEQSYQQGQQGDEGQKGTNEVSQ